MYLDNDAEFCKIDKRGTPYKIGSDGRKLAATKRPVDRYTPEAWRALGGAGRKQVLEEMKKAEKAEEKKKKKEKAKAKEKKVSPAGALVRRAEIAYQNALAALNGHTPKAVPAHDPKLTGVCV